MAGRSLNPGGSGWRWVLLASGTRWPSMNHSPCSTVPYLRKWQRSSITTLYERALGLKPDLWKAKMPMTFCRNSTVSRVSLATG